MHAKYALPEGAPGLVLGTTLSLKYSRKQSLNTEPSVTPKQNPLHGQGKQVIHRTRASALHVEPMGSVPVII